MEYQFDVSLHVPSLVTAASQEEAEDKADQIVETLIAGSDLVNAYPDVDYTGNGNAQPYTLGVAYRFQMQVEATSMEEAKNAVQDRVKELIRGSQLAHRKKAVAYQFSDEQPGLDALLGWIDEDQPFAIAADAALWHIACAKAQYGEDAVDRAIEMSERYSEERIIASPRLFKQYPKDREGNLLHIIWGRDHIQEVRNAWVNQEEVYASCECLNLLYDEPREAVSNE